jgi:hypothetical protein
VVERRLQKCDGCCANGISLLRLLSVSRNIKFYRILAQSSNLSVDSEKSEKIRASHSAHSRPKPRRSTRMSTNNEDCARMTENKYPKVCVLVTQIILWHPVLYIGRGSVLMCTRGVINAKTIGQRWEQFIAADNKT